MQRSEPDLFVHGLVGGAIAGLVVAGWFFAVDLFAGENFQTPARLASVVLGEEFRGAWPRHIVVYTILHFGIFATLGLAATLAIKAINIPPGLSLGILFGIGVLNTVHYTGLLVTGTNLLTVIPVTHVVAANLFGGVLMMAYLHRAMGAETPLGWNVLRRYPILFEGLGTGLIGAVAVALAFFLLDLATRTPFFTPAAIGSAILLGAADATEIQFSLGVILAYSFLHLATFLAVGVVFAWLATRIQAAPAIWIRSAVVLVLLEAFFLGTVTIASGWVLRELGWYYVLAANLIAVLSMGVWILRRQRNLQTQPPELATT